jgi:hypothetical protein
MIGTTLLIVALVAAVIGVAVVGLRVRKLRHDDLLAAERRRHATALPPSPYQPTGAIHVLADGEEPSEIRREPRLPSLEPDHASVFTDVGGAETTATALPRPRRDERRALERSFHRSRISMSSLRAAVIAVVVVASLVVVGALLQGRSHTSHPTTTSTSQVTTTSTPG